MDIVKIVNELTEEELMSGAKSFGATKTLPFPKECLYCICESCDECKFLEEV